MYCSTREKNNNEVPSYQAILNGLALDGGLYVKKDIKKYSLTDLEKLINLSYQDLALFVFKEFLDGFEEKSLKEIINQAYQNNFDVKNIVNVKKTNDCYFLELYHGPTLAFKDVALQILPYLMDESKRLAQLDINKQKSIILTATSGDTGSAALMGFKNNKNTKMIVLYPTKGVSKIQEQQMLSLADENLRVIAIDGNFDDAQRLVKKVFNDEKLKEYSPNLPLSSANSINIGRLIPQVVYYFYSYFDLVRKDEIKFGESINYVVPTGNFGNILACFLAKTMGLPINKLICASNINNVLTDFFNKEEYNKNREFKKTMSPSMDILVSSNLERLLYYGTKDSVVVKEWMKELDQKGIYHCNSEMQKVMKDFYADYALENETLQAIKKVYNDNDYLIDTHTAVGYAVYKKYLEKNNDNIKTVIASTAHPYKFPLSILKALDEEEIDNIDEFQAISILEKKTKVLEPSIIKSLRKEYKKTVWTKEEAYNNICVLLKELNYEKN